MKHVRHRASERRTTLARPMQPTEHMRTKLIALSALTCITGGSALLAPAATQSGLPLCESVRGTSCRSTSLLACTSEEGNTEAMACRNGVWVYA